MRLAVVTPWSSPFVYRAFAENLANLLCSFRRPDWQCQFFMGQGCDPAARHVSMCLQALEWDADLICIIGADQIHPTEMLDRLVDRYIQTGGQVISALVPFRGYIGDQEMRPFQPMAWRLVCQGVRECRGMDKDPDMFQEIDVDAGGLQRVDVIGTGVLMFHRDHLLSLAKPWFYYKVDPATMQRAADMDTRFVWRLATEAGAEVWCDTTIDVRHLHIFEIDETYNERFSDWKRPGAGDPAICRYEKDDSTSRNPRAA